MERWGVWAVSTFCLVASLYVVCGRAHCYSLMFRTCEPEKFFPGIMRMCYFVESIGVFAAYVCFVGCFCRVFIQFGFYSNNQISSTLTSTMASATSLNDDAIFFVGAQQLYLSTMHNQLTTNLPRINWLLNQTAPLRDGVPALKASLDSLSSYYQGYVLILAPFVITC
jgi:hypothetical protein